MKEMYKRFSELKIDPGIVPMPVEDAEKERVKGLRLNKRKSRHVLRNTFIAAAVLSLSIVTFSASFPTFAAQMPILGSIFSLFQKESQLVGDFGAYTTAIGMTQEDQSVKITVTDAVYDGESVSISFIINSDRDLGENPVLQSQLSIAGYDEQNYTSGTYMVEKTGENQYAGVAITYLMTGSKPKEAINVNWHVREVSIVEDLKNYIAGDWTFDFMLNPLEAETVQLTGLTATDQGITVNVRKMTTTPVSNTIYVSNRTEQELRDKWDHVSLHFMVKDNLGNEYDVLQNGGYGSNSYDVSRRIMTPAFDSKATSIIITPVASAYNEGSSSDLELIEEFTLPSIEVPLVGNE